MRRPVIAGNWKMYHGPKEAARLVEELKPLVRDVRPEVVVCPPFVDLLTVVQAVQDSNIQVGAQNMHWEENGAYTGEISPTMLSEAGSRYVIIGHSERRQYFGETDEWVNKKVKAAFMHGLKPIVCVGETLEQRESGITRQVVEEQVRSGLQGLEPKQAGDLIIAYEPIWAIGTGKTASADDAEDVIAFIRTVLGQMYGNDAAGKIRILYGGSVKPENIGELMQKPDIDGALVGGASLKADSFGRIVCY